MTDEDLKLERGFEVFKIRMLHILDDITRETFSGAIKWEISKNEKFTFLARYVPDLYTDSPVLLKMSNPPVLSRSNKYDFNPYLFFRSLKMLDGIFNDCIPFFRPEENQLRRRDNNKPDYWDFEVSNGVKTVFDYIRLRDLRPHEDIWRSPIPDHRIPYQVKFWEMLMQGELFNKDSGADEWYVCHDKYTLLNVLKYLIRCREDQTYV